MKIPSLYSRSSTRACFGSIAGGVIALSVMAAPLEAAIINDVDFEVAYSGNALPTASDPTWTQGGSAGSASASSETGILTLQTNATGSYRYILNESSGYWDGADAEGITVEFSLSVISQTGSRSATHLSLSDGSKNYNFQIAEDEIFLGATSTSGARYAMDTTVVNTFRLTLSEGVMSVYVNQNVTPVIVGYEGVASTGNEIYWGDNSNFTGGTTHWDYLAFTTSGAFAPVPEPSLLSLGGLGALLMLFVSRRYRKQNTVLS